MFQTHTVGQTKEALLCSDYSLFDFSSAEISGNLLSPQVSVTGDLFLPLDIHIKEFSSSRAALADVLKRRRGGWDGASFGLVPASDHFSIHQLWSFMLQVQCSGLRLRAYSPYHATRDILGEQ